MAKVFCWFVIIVSIIYAWNIGWIENAFKANIQSRQEQVFCDENGACEEVKYKNVSDLIKENNFFKKKT